MANIEAFLQRDLAADVVVITNEVGCGIVPGNLLGREYRDRAGEINQALARAAKEVFWMVFGIPVTVKPPPRPL